MYRRSASGSVTAIDVDIDDDMDLLIEQVHALRQLDAECPSDAVTEARRYDVSIRWGAVMAGRLRRLVYYDARGMLAETDQRRFHELCRELNALSDVIERFGLAQPVLTDRTPELTLSREREGCREPAPSNSRRGLLHRG